MGDVKERIDDVGDSVHDGLQTMQEQLKEYVLDTIGSSEIKLARKDDALEAMVIALKEEISELKGELEMINDNSGSDGGNRKPRNGKRRPNSPKEKRGKLRCYFCNGPYMKRDCPKVSTFTAIKKNDEPEEEKAIEKKASRVNSMILFPKKRNGREGLMFVDISIAGRNGSALIDMGASGLFISEKAAKKLELNLNLYRSRIKEYEIRSRKVESRRVAESIYPNLYEVCLKCISYLMLKDIVAIGSLGIIEDCHHTIELYFGTF
ncbi:hypothetical protein F383_07599 [Gossypium arboreum]|uniref:Uncharacterized protein n=1 Tax=Gossypium arboreum TaxID=29729 RepID=A0A0B0P634_GOSAR|nr:hypothetical protein F383_07599 [Gossypium arboreum]